MARAAVGMALIFPLKNVHSKSVIVERDYMKRRDGDNVQLADQSVPSDPNPSPSPSPKPFNLFDVEPFSIVGGGKLEPLQSNAAESLPSTVDAKSALVKAPPYRTALYIGIATLIIGIVIGILLGR
jgi:hypothetical protein